MDPLSHFRSAVIHLYATILIDQHQCTRLIKLGGGKRYAELHRSNCQAAFSGSRLAIPRFYRASPRYEITRGKKLLPNSLDPIISDSLPVRCRIGLTASVVEISFTDHFGSQSEPTANSVDDLFDHQHSLWPTKTPERGIGCDVCLCHLAGEFSVG